MQKETNRRLKKQKQERKKNTRLQWPTCTDVRAGLSLDLFVL